MSENRRTDAFARHWIDVYTNAKDPTPSQELSRTCSPSST
jgi:hypothetical protein